ncbi:hypothetical protein [Streptomyces fructofermentans]|uniref:Uncharacterized protein n=1 Tax=Streptomyces fructofermentans TaxID=152141 RepID=A0A918NKS4_9ACTN|nr:hypothetical protein [Streptomyces fructofermentans]GGX76321.1 hypothetical protein GCM10010515_50040 [Streptomyces fructofermentans]
MTREQEEARRWLAECGVVESGTGDGWFDTEEGRPLTANEVAHSWAGQVFADADSDSRTDAGAEPDRVAQLRLAFGLLDLLDDYWVACEIRFADRGPRGPLPADVLWGGYRRRLEADRDAEALTYSLWADWFEDPDTAATAFAEVLGNDIDRVAADGSDGPLRRASRVLSCSGPVPWPVKQKAYEAAARLPALHEPLFEGLLAGYHDVYGSLEPARASALLARLDLAPDTRHLAALRSVVAAGHRNHRSSPLAWEEAARAAGRGGGGAADGPDPGRAVLPDR